MSDKKKISDSDKSLFREAVAGVKPISADTRIHPVRLRPSTKPQQTRADEQQVLIDMMSDPDMLADIENGDELLFIRPGIQLKVQRKLRRGEYSIQAELDLHGYTVAEARQAISEFLPDCRKKNSRYVRIIHGKGLGSFQKLPVLKTHVAHWLKQRDEVLAFCSARPADGGTGAVYVLLKKRK